MSEKKQQKRNRLIPILLLVTALLLLLTAAGGYYLRGTGEVTEGLEDMRDNAVLHAASVGLIDNIAQSARAEKLKELRADKDFRKRGLDEVNGICDAAMMEARAEAEKLYSNPKVEDSDALRAAILKLEEMLAVSGTLQESEHNVFSDIYVSLVESVADWKAVAGENVTDEQVLSNLKKASPELQSEASSHLLPGFLRMARDMAAKQAQEEEEELKNQMLSLLSSEIVDWSAYSGLTGDALWDKLTADIPELKENTAYKNDILAKAGEHILAAEKGETLSTPAGKEEGAVVLNDVQADYAYFTPTEELLRLQEENETAYDGLLQQLKAIIPDLSTLSNKLQATLRTNVEKVVWFEDSDFSSRYTLYAGHGAEQVLGAIGWKIKLAAMAKSLLLAGIAVLLLGLVMFFWTELTRRFGVPRTIIALFFVYLCLLAEQYNISVRMMMGNVLERMTMYGILVLAMMPGIQCGIGLNMGMTIGCISGLLGIVLSLQFNMTGFGALIFACVSGGLVSLPLGWAYSKLLNRMKGNEMTISTYVGFSFVSLMCIGWMLLPFNNPKIIWLLSGRGLRVTHSLLGSFAHLLDNALSFSIFGIKVPTGGLLFLGVCCLMMWLFSRTRTGIAMTAVGSNPRFAEASGINVNHMRTIGTVLSTVIAAVGIVIYSQAFGYAQLYTAPRQLGFIASSAILIGGATVSKAKVSHVLLGVFLFEGVLVFGQQIANSVVAGGGLSEVMRIMISNGIILYALTQSGGGRRD